MIIAYGDDQLELRGKALNEAPEASPSSLIQRLANHSGFIDRMSAETAPTRLFKNGAVANRA